MRSTDIRTETLLTCVLEGDALARRETLVAVTRDLARRADPGHLATILAEVFSNAARHGRVRRLVVRARRRRAVLLLAFAHDPALSPDACAAFARGKAGWLPAADQSVAGGLGVPLLCRLARRLSISPDRKTLRLWLPLPTSEV